MKYELFLLGGGHITTFDSMWHFKEGEQIFFQEEREKRNFIIIRLTHDVFHKNEHVIRLYCREKKVY